MRAINEVLVEYLQDPATEFGRKYYVLARRSHSQEAMDRFKNNIIEFFRTRLDEKRAVIALDLLYYILRENDMVGMSQIFRFLTRKELAGDFYRKYRDHTCHALMLFFLGCYLYETIAAFKDLYASQHAAESGVDDDMLKTGFLYQWSCIALFHDFGYFFDVDEPLLNAHDVSAADIETSQTKREKIRAFFAFLEDYFNKYLSRQYVEWCGEPDAATEQAIGRYQNFAFPQVSLPYTSHLDVRLISDLRVAGSYLGDAAIDGFDLLEEFCAAHHPRYTGVLHDYFKALNERGAPYSEPYVRVWDHGIASALLFLKLSAFGFRVTDLLKTLNPGVKKMNDQGVRAVAAVFHTQLALWDYREVVFRKSLAASALAMALHNLRIVTDSPAFREERYEPSDLRAFDAVRTRIFPVSAEENFLGFLVLLVDQLQDWDRYRIVRTGDAAASRILENQHINIGSEHGRCIMEFVGDDWVRARANEISNDLAAFTSDTARYLEIRR
jgi:hypothetical protein